jgi:hypothetical protein
MGSRDTLMDGVRWSDLMGTGSSWLATGAREGSGCPSPLKSYAGRRSTRMSGPQIAPSGDGSG